MGEEGKWRRGDEEVGRKDRGREEGGGEGYLDP